jgi:hypothetical protein
MDINIENTIKDLVSSFLYYDRKEDEELPVGEIERALDEGEITVDEIIKIFADSLKKGLGE